MPHRHDWRARLKPGLDCLGQRRSRAVAQHRGRGSVKVSSLGELENVSFIHGVSTSVEKWELRTAAIAALPPYAVTNFRPIAPHTKASGNADGGAVVSLNSVSFGWATAMLI